MMNPTLAQWRISVARHHAIADWLHELLPDQRSPRELVDSLLLQVVIRTEWLNTVSDFTLL